MTTTSRTFTTAAAPSTVVEYLADFTNATEWDPGTEKCERIDSGPVKVGSTWHNTSKIAGLSTELTYTLEELRGDKIVLVGRNDTATSTDTIDVTADGTGSSVTYTAEIEMHGVAKLAAPATKLIFEKLGNDTEDKLVDALDRLA